MGEEGAIGELLGEKAISEYGSSGTIVCEKVFSYRRTLIIFITSSKLEE